jgi:ESS family glutamate:Na+ symporter
VVWGQYAVGIGICGFVLMPLFGVHPAFGNLLEMGFEGGHGTVGGMSQAFLSKNWPDGLALGYTLATIGMICGIGFGMVLINWAYSKGYVNTVQPFSKRSLSERIGIHERDLRPSAGLQTVASDSVDSLAWHIAIVGVSVLIGWGISLLIPLEGFPLFPFCMIGGVVLQTVAKIAKVDLLIDREQIQRISGAALDYLSLAAVATIQLSVVAQNWMPLTVMAVAGLAWTIFAVIFFSPRMFKDAWFERGIAEFGQASGVTATGLLLLRTVDPENKTAAAAAFAGKQLFHEPAMGVWVALAFAFIFTLGWLKVFLISAAMLAVWTMVAALLIWRNKKK